MKLGIVALALLTPTLALAQPPPASGPKTLAAQRWSQLPLRDGLSKLTKESGILVVADGPLGGRRVTLSSVGGSLENVLTQLLTQLPKGTQIKRTYLPSAAVTSPKPNVELIATLVEINEALLVPLNPGVKPEPDTVVIQGRVIPKDKAEAVLAALDLKPVFLLLDPKSKDASHGFAGLQQEAMRLWQSMTPEQRKAAVDRQWEDFLNMDPNVRKQYMQQMGEQAMGIMQKLQQLPPEQQKELFGGLLPPGGPGGGGN